MKRIRSAKVSILLAGALLFFGFVLPTNAGTLPVITLTKANPQVNVDVTSGAGDWVFTYVVTGKVSFLSLNIKNNPGAGDVCAHTDVRQPKKGLGSRTAENLPAAELNACGDQFQDTNGIPLNLQAFIQTADANARVDITVVYPDP